MAEATGQTVGRRLWGLPWLALLAFGNRKPGYLAPDIGTATSVIRCTCPLGSGTSPYTMYGEVSTRYHVASSWRSEYRRSSTFHAWMSDPSTFTETWRRTEKIRRA